LVANASSPRIPRDRPLEYDLVTSWLANRADCLWCNAVTMSQLIGPAFSAIWLHLMGSCLASFP
jgi:hypothetical protein